jgi:hypothetical protein
MKLPSGFGASAADADEALAQATAVCRGVHTLTAELAASGKLSGQRFRARLSVGVAAPASARIEAVAPFGAPMFILAADNDDTTLLLPRDDRVLRHGRSAEVLHAVAGMLYSAADLRILLTGCGPETPPSEAHAIGPDWRVLQYGGQYAVYLHRSGAAQPWALVAKRNSSSRVEYREFLNGLPHSIRVISTGNDDGDVGVYDITLALSQVETNVPLGPDVFRVDVPRSAQPITLDELRRARPGVREN